MPSIKFKNSSTPGAVPATLAQGELAINWADKKAWIGPVGGGAPIKIIGSIASQDANSIAITGGAVSLSSLGTGTASTASASTVNVGGTGLSSVRASNTGTDASATMTGSGVNWSGDKLKGRLKNIYTYNGSGTYTYTKSGPDVNRVHVMLTGAGGGARAYSECGGAGGFSEGVYDATGMTTVTVTVGGGSGGGAYFGVSGQGGTTSFGGYISASGGYGANQNDSHSGGHGGLGYGGSINTYGGSGSSHTNNDQYSPSNSCQGQGGASFFGGSMAADRPDWSISTVGAPGSGGVAISPGHNGQGGRGGKDGCCIVYEYI
jgi:hypothetical protein